MNMVLVQGILILDTYLVSLLGEAALAAIGIAAAISGLLLGAIIALSQATQILVAQAQGAQDPTALKTAFWAALAIGGTVSALGLGLVWWMGDRVVLAAAHTPEIATSAITYLQIFSVVIVFQTVSQVISCHFNGTGRTRLPLYGHLAELPVNVGLSIVLIFGLYGFPELGLAGAAVGSAGAAVVRFALLGLWLWQADRAVILAPGWARGTFARSVRFHLLFTLPVALTFFGMAACNTVSALLYAQMSLTDFAAMTLILPWVQVVGVIMIAWSQSSGIFVGQLLGGQAEDATLNTFLAQAWRACLTIAALVSCLYLLASLAFPLIYQDLQPQTLDALWSFLPVLLVLNFPKGSNAMCGTTLRAGGDTVSVMAIHLGAQWLYRVPVIAVFVLVLELSVTWVFALLLFEELLKFPFFHLRFQSGKWRRVLRD